MRGRQAGPPWQEQAAGKAAAHRSVPAAERVALPRTAAPRRLCAAWPRRTPICAPFMQSSVTLRLVACVLASVTGSNSGNLIRTVLLMRLENAGCKASLPDHAGRSVHIANKEFATKRSC